MPSLYGKALYPCYRTRACGQPGAAASVLHSVFERYGTKRDGGMTALGFEIYEALSIVTRYRERLFGDDREQTWG